MIIDQVTGAALQKPFCEAALLIFRICRFNLFFQKGGTDMGAENLN